MNKNVRAIIRGKEYELTSSEVIEKLKGVEPELIRQHYVTINGKDYPVKQVISVVTGLPRMAFTSMYAYTILPKLGFEVKQRG